MLRNDGIVKLARECVANERIHPDAMTSYDVHTFATAAIYVILRFLMMLWREVSFCEAFSTFRQSLENERGSLKGGCREAVVVDIQRRDRGVFVCGDRDEKGGEPSVAQ